MGIYVDSNKRVFYTNEHHNLVSTCTNNNPTTIKLDDVRIHSIFKRMRTKEHDGDGNPLIYALKNKKGFTISKSEIKKFFTDMNTIIDKICLNKNYDLLIVPPSNHKIASFLAKKIARKCTWNYSPVFFRKATAYEVIEEVHLSSIRNDHQKEVKKVLATLKNLGDTPFTMKEVPNNIRKYFNPLKIASDPCELEGIHNVLIVDDLLSTGSTIVKASELIRSIKSDINVEGLCLLGALNKK